MGVNQSVDMSGVTQDVKALLAKDTSGHGIEHVERVLKLALKFSENERADREVVTLATLLHDVDDYKLFGQESADNLINANKILNKHRVKTSTKNKVLEIIHSMGYNRYLEGIRPNTLEGMVVSDADMCDAIGAIGILRTHAYALSKGDEFFDKTLDPEESMMSGAQYRLSKKSHSVQHFFDKLLKITAILMTESGRKEGESRQAIMVDFLNELFLEEDAQEWITYLSAFNKKD